MARMGHAAAVCARMSCLLAIPALAAWATGRPFIFPSLGPSAFALTLGEDVVSSRRVIGGHTVGIICGFIAYHLLAPGLGFHVFHVTWSSADLRLAASGVLSLWLTAAGMLVTHTRHAPACATTLIISLGLMPTLTDCAVILLAVLSLYGTHSLLLKRWRRPI